MGQVSDILTSEEWKSKSPLEKAAARRDLFQLTVNQNPQLQEALSTKDAAGKQEVFNAWRTDVEAKFPEAFKSPARNVVKVGKNSFSEEDAVSPIYDFRTETVLEALNPSFKEGTVIEQNADRKKVIDSLSEEQKKAVLPFYAQRYGTKGADDFGGISILFPEKSTLRSTAELAVPTALRVGPALIASTTKNPRLVAAATALGEGMAQSTEQMFGNRAAMSPAEIGLSSLLSIIPSQTIGRIVNPYLKAGATAGVRAAEGAAQGALFESGRQILEGENDPMRVLMTGGAGGALGALLGGLEGRFAARFAGKSASQVREELPDLIKAADTPEAKQQLTDLQRRIEESLGSRLPPRSASNSAATFSAALDQPAPAAASTALADQLRVEQVVDEALAPVQPRADTTEAQRRIEAAVNPSLQELAPATFVGVQGGLPEAGIPDTPLFNLTRDAAGTVQDSTVTRETLERAGFRVPQTPDIAPGQRVEIPLENIDANAGVAAASFDPLLNAPIPSAANTELAAREIRAADFIRSRFEEAEGVIRANQLGGPEVRPNLPPAEAQITVMQMGDRRAVQVDIPGAPGERPVFSGTPEQAAAAGYEFQLPADLPEGRYSYEQINPSAYAQQSIDAPAPQGSAQPNNQSPIGSQEVPRGLPEVVQVGSQGDALIDPRVSLSPQAQDVVRLYETTGFDKRGYIDPVLARSLATSGAGGIGGAAYGLGQGETAEERIKNGLVFSILGAGGGYAVGRSFGRMLQSRTNTSGTPELDTWYKRLSKSQDSASIAKRVRDLPNRLRSAMTTSMAPLDKLPREIAAANNTPLKEPKLPLSRQFEAVAGASGKALMDAEAYSNSVLAKVRDNEWQDFNALLAIKRTGQRLQQDQNDEIRRAKILTSYKNAAEIEDRIGQINYRIAQNRKALEQAPGDVDLIREASELVGFKNESQEDLNLLNRRSDQRRVAGETLQTVDAALAGLEKKLGPKRFAELDQLAAGPVQQEADKALRVMVAAGRMSPEQYAAIKSSNDFYAPFRVMQYAEDFDGFSGMKANPVDTTAKYTRAIQGIDSADFQLDDPARVMMEKIYQARILAEKNLKMKVLADMADEDPSGTVVKKLSANESAPRGMETVNYFDNGVARQLAVPPEVAEAVKGMNPAGTGVISRFVRTINRPFRFGATAGNIGFQMVNAPADLFRQATISKYGIGRGNAIVDTARYPLDFIHALYSSILSRPSTASAAGAVAGFYTGYQTGDTTSERLRNAAAGAVAGGFAGRGIQRGIGAGVSALRQAGATGAADALDPTALYRQFYESGSAGSTLQDMLSNTANRMSRTNAVQQVLKGPGVLSTLQDFGKAVEETTKLLGFKRGLRIEGIDKLPKQQAFNKLQEVVAETRNFAGSPDFSVAGTLIKDLNAAVVFLNPRIQGLSEDAGRLFGRDGIKPAAAAWTAMATAVGLPAAYLWSRNNAPENKADYAQVSPEEKWRNAMIPRYDEQGKPLYFTNERGQLVREYYRIPLRDTTQNFYQLVQSSLDYANSQDPERVAQFGAQLTENLSPINIQGKTAAERAESAISSFGPVVTIPYMLATQRIPGLHREIFADDNIRQASPENQFTATTPQVYKDMAQLAPQWLADPLRSPLMLEQLASAGTGGILSQFTPPRAIPGRDETATALQQSPLGRRFVRSGYVYDPAPQEARDVLQEQADVRTTAKRTGSELFMELNVLPPKDRAARIRQLPSDQKAMLREEVLRRQKRPADEEIALIGRMGVENGTRAKYLFDRVSGLTPQERTQFLKDLQQAKLLSNDVKKQITFLLQAQQRGARQQGRN